MPGIITADEQLRFPIPIYVRAEMAIEFACPFCQMRGTLVALNTDNALQMHWANDPDNAGALKVTWTGCKCDTCGKSFTMEASKVFVSQSGPAQ
jgi:transcription elongation factor Elf1